MSDAIGQRIKSEGGCKAIAPNLPYAPAISVTLPRDKKASLIGAFRWRGIGNCILPAEKVLYRPEEDGLRRPYRNAIAQHRQAVGKPHQLEPR